VLTHACAAQAPGDERSATAQQRVQPQPQPSNRRPPEPEDGWLDRLVDWLMPQERVCALSRGSCCGSSYHSAVDCIHSETVVATKGIN